jgi:hypothetical protein
MEVRKKRREEALHTGRYVLAEEAQRATAAVVTEVIAACERFIIAEARRHAQAEGADPRAAAAEARQRWRDQRFSLADELLKKADAATYTEAELREMGGA